MLKAQDIFVVVALAGREDADWTYDRLAVELDLSTSQVFNALARADAAHLFVKGDRRVIRRNLMEFLIHGIRYAFATAPGRIVRGVPAGWQAPGLSELMVDDSSESYVWPNPMGLVRGQSIEPLHSSVPLVAMENEHLHALYALIDVMRVGSARERKVAAAELERRLAR